MPGQCSIDRTNYPNFFLENLRPYRWGRGIENGHNVTGEGGESKNSEKKAGVVYGPDHILYMMAISITPMSQKEELISYAYSLEQFYSWKCSNVAFRRFSCENERKQFFFYYI